MNKPHFILAAISTTVLTASFMVGCDNKTQNSNEASEKTETAPVTEQSQQAAVPFDKAAEMEKMKMITQSFVGALKGELGKAMKEGGPVNGLSVCHTKAMEITQQAAKEHGVNLTRVSLKNRNPNNVPNDWQKAVLEDFDARVANGEDPKPMAFNEVVETDGKKQLRFMKALPTGALCLSCHGTEIHQDVQARLNELYPQDKATGYLQNQVRGAVVIVKDLN